MKTSLAAVAALSLLAASNASACITAQQAFNTTFKGNANWDLNDYGRIHHDADDPNCAEAAMASLTEKLRKHLAAETPAYKPFQNWLDGYLVAEIFAATMRIGANGWASEDLNAQLVRLVRQYRHDAPDASGTCGGDNFNTCMDNHAGAAAAYAWMAAYMKRRPTHFTQEQVDAKIALAVDRLQKSLKPITAAEPQNGVCLRDVPAGDRDYASLCTGTLGELRAGIAATFTVNGAQQLLHYGFGLMTTVASAKLGLEQAGSTWDFSADEKLIAWALMEEVQRHYDPNDATGYKRDCVGPNRDQQGNVIAGSYNETTDCGAGYHPNMYGLRAFYDTRLGGAPPGKYDSNSFDASKFRLEDQWSYLDDGLTRVDKQHFSYGRFETYGIEAYAWFVGPRTFMPYDDYAPAGWVDGISETGFARGWACDRDATDQRVFVDFHDGATRVARATANQYSGPVHAAQCGSGTAHGWSVQLPLSSHDRPLRVWVRDYTWIGPTEIGCTNGCTWSFAEARRRSRGRSSGKIPPSRGVER